jgi:tRNA modification GTPase
MMNDTIYALSSGALPSGVAVIRVSGPMTSEIATTILEKPLKPRHAELRSIRSRNGQLIDSGLAILFRGPNSFTGEDCLELQVHGGRAVVMRLMEELSQFPDTRPADAGEFTKRAFENGKIDLTEAEGLADLISAETEMQRRLATEQAKGGLSKLYSAWAHRITHARAMIEAELDFSDEDDVPGSVSDRVWSDMQALEGEILAHLAAAKTGEIIRDGFKIAIVGHPNAGKSSLLNALARRDIAIVTDIPGTTRDVLTVDMNIAGYAVRLFDTAGIRQTDDPVEMEGVRRAHLAAADADLILLLQEPGAATDRLLDLDEKEVLTVFTKSDLLEQVRGTGISISVRTDNGLDELVKAIETVLARRIKVESLAIPSRIRHVNHLKEALHYLSNAVSSDEWQLDIRAEHLRLAANHLGRITGTVDVEALLDVIFSEFCIGK